MVPSYTLYSSHIELTLPNGRTQIVYRTVDSGLLITRKKLQTVFGVDHPAVILGEDSNKQLIVVHHHYKYDVPVVHTLTEYADGEEVQYDDRDVHYSQNQVLERALQLWAEQASYDLFNSNCQHFVTKAACKESYSESVHNGITWMIVFFIVLLILYVIYRSKDTAVTIAAVVVGGFAVNEIFKARINSLPTASKKTALQHNIF